MKNGIVLIDYTILLRERGMNVRDASTTAARSRLRPILMTTLTTVLGMLPMAIGLGEGSEMWRSLGVTVCWGLSVSTLVTLVLIPYAYLPTLAVAFNYSINAMANDYNFSQYKWSPYSYVGLSLSIPIFSGGKRLNAVRQTKVQAAELDITRSNTERQLQIAIRQYLGTMDTATRTYAAASSAVETAAKAYGIARQSYDVGRSTLTDLNDAQLALTQAELGVCQAIFNYLSAKSDVEGLLGADFIENNDSNE